MRVQQDNPHEPHLPITACSQRGYRVETDRERETSFSEAARSIDLCRLKIMGLLLPCEKEEEMFLNGNPALSTFPF